MPNIRIQNRVIENLPSTEEISVVGDKIEEIKIKVEDMLSEKLLVEDAAPEIIVAFPTDINDERDLIDFCKEVGKQLYPMLKAYYEF